MPELYKPREHQRKGANFAARVRRCNLWFDPGLGKTSTALTAMDIVNLLGVDSFPVLVIAPLRVARDVWPAEVRKWAHTCHLRVSAIIGNEEQREEARLAQADVYCINYENLQWLVGRYGKKQWPFRWVVADESQRLQGFRLRNSTKRSKALASVAKYTSRWINLSGTPTPKDLRALWGQMWFIDGGRRLGTTYTAFEKRWFNVNEYSREVTPKPNAAREIAALIADVTMTVKLADVFDVPPILVNPIPVELPAQARKMYREMFRELVLELRSGTITAANAADKTNKCLQIASGAIYTNPQRTAWALVHDEKITALRDLLGELEGHNVIIVYQYKHDRDRILKALPEARQLKTTKDEDDWNAGRISRLVLHPGSAGHGLNLQDGGHHVILFSQTWDLEHYLQVIERVGPARQAQAGHDRRVCLHLLVGKGTLEESVIERRTTKRAVMDYLRDCVAEVQ